MAGQIFKSVFAIKETAAPTEATLTVCSESLCLVADWKLLVAFEEPLSAVEVQTGWGFLDLSFPSTPSFFFFARSCGKSTVFLSSQMEQNFSLINYLDKEF